MKNRLKQSVFVALLYGVTAMLSLNLTSCEEGGIDSQPAMGVKLGTTAQTAYTVTSVSPRDIKFTVTSNTPWTITSDQTWCAPTPVSSTVSALVQEVTVTMTDNELLTERKAVLTIQGEGVEKQEITITQDSKGALSVAMFETEVPFSRGGEVREFTVVSNKDWTITSDKAWLTFDVSAVAGSDKVNTVKATADNNTANIRRATITIKNGLEEKTYQVTQEGNQLEVANGTDTLYLALGETKIYQVQANMAWKAEVVPGSEWVEIVSGASGDGNGEMTLKVKANPVFANRHGQVRIKPTVPVQGLEDVILVVNQNVNLWNDITAGGSATYGEKGEVILTSVGEKARIVTNTPNKLGTYVWKFASIDIPAGSNAYFDINGWPDESPSTANYHIFLRNVSPTFSIGGGFNWDWADNTINLGGRKLQDLKELTLKLDHDPVNDGKIEFILYFNGDLILKRSNLGNPYTDPAEKGVVLYFGIFDGPATFTIESFTVTPIE